MTDLTICANHLSSENVTNREFKESLATLTAQQDDLVQQISGLQASLNIFMQESYHHDKCESQRESLTTLIHSAISTGAVIGGAFAMHVSLPTLPVVGACAVGVLVLESVWNFGIEPLFCN